MAKVYDLLEAELTDAKAELSRYEIEQLQLVIDGVKTTLQDDTSAENKVQHLRDLLDV
jgi:hypothetical protein